MKILVTGGAGFIGSHLVEALLAKGHQIRVLDDLSSGHLDNLLGLNVDFVEGSVSDYECVQEVMRDIELVYHQAALVSVPKSVENPALNHAVNVTGTFNVFEAARVEGVSRIVYASSAAVYGNDPKLPKEEHDAIAPITPYAMAKRTSELTAVVYAQMYGLESVGLRYMNVFGPRQDPSSPYSGVLSIFSQRALAGDGVTIFGDGEQTRDFVFVKDVVQANLLAGFKPILEAEKAVWFNVGRGVQTSLNDIVAMLRHICDQPLPITYQPVRQGDIQHSVADIQKIQEQLGFEPETAVVDGLRQTLALFKENQ
ncbi:MAG: SDR family oxidoreductase [Chloroflexota bacterium]